MGLRPWKKRSERVVIENPWWTYRCDDVIRPDGSTGEYHYVHSRGSSLILPRLPDGTILTVNQYRYVAGRESLEFPCGSVKPGSDHEETAKTELREETGYLASSFVAAGEFNPYNGVTDELCRVFLADGLTFVGSEPEETEEFEILPLRPEEIDGKIGDGTIWDGMTIAAWHLVRAKRMI